MRCVTCERNTGLNRAVVDTVEERVLGGFCRDCEHSHFGKSLGHARWNDPDGCLFCSRDGFVELRTIDVSVTAGMESGPLDAQLRVDLSAEPSSPGMCDEHLVLISGGETEERDVATPRDRIR